MIYLDYEWDLDPNGIMFDDHLNVDALGWDQGDYFKFVVSDDGKKYLMKVNKLEEFIVKGAEDVRNSRDD